MALGLALTHETIVRDDQAESFDELDAYDDAELSVTRTPKSILLALVVAIVTCLLAYLQAPNTVKVHHQLRESADAATPAVQAFQGYSDHWATAEVAPMPLGLDG